MHASADAGVQPEHVDVVDDPACSAPSCGSAAEKRQSVAGPVCWWYRRRTWTIGTGYRPEFIMDAGHAPDADTASKAATFEVSCFRDAAPLVRDLEGRA